MAIKTYNLKTQGDLYVSKHFKVKEFRSYSDTYNILYSNTVKIDDALINILERLRDKLNLISIVIINGYRCPAHNSAVGGGSASRHLYGMAADIICKDISGVVSGELVCCTLENMGVYGIGYMAHNHVHVDSRLPKDKWFGDETKKINGKYVNVGASFYTYWGIKKTITQTTANINTVNTAITDPKIKAEAMALITEIKKKITIDDTNTLLANLISYYNGSLWWVIKRLLSLNYTGKKGILGKTDIYRRTLKIIKISKPTAFNNELLKAGHNSLFWVIKRLLDLQEVD